MTDTSSEWPNFAQDYAGAELFKLFSEQARRTAQLINNGNFSREAANRLYKNILSHLRLLRDGFKQGNEALLSVDGSLSPSVQTEIALLLAQLAYATSKRRFSEAGLSFFSSAFNQASTPAAMSRLADFVEIMIGYVNVPASSYAANYRGAGVVGAERRNNSFQGTHRNRHRNRPRHNNRDPQRKEQENISASTDKKDKSSFSSSSGDTSL
jgi:hypothetical protein